MTILSPRWGLYFRMACTTTNITAPLGLNYHRLQLNSLMMLKILRSPIFILCTISFWNCAEQHNLQCGAFQKMEAITAGGTTITYMLDTNFLYKFEFFESWGPLDSKKYGYQEDTLTLAWYRNRKFYTDSTARQAIIRGFANDSIFPDDYSFKDVHFNELKGVLSEVQTKNESRMTFFGINMLTDKLLIAEYTSNADQSYNRDNLFCLLNSMTFKDSIKTSQ